MRTNAHTSTAIGKYKPQDATTNPSLILAAAKKPEYAAVLDAAIAHIKDQEGGSIDEKVDSALDNLLVQFGKKILEIIPGKVSTEVDAAFSFDTKASVEKALHIIDVRTRCAISCLPAGSNHPNSSTPRRASPRTVS